MERESSRGASPLVDVALNAVEDRLKQTSDSSEATTTVVPAWRAPARAVVYSNSNSVDPVVIMGNANQNFPVMDLDTTGGPGCVKQGAQDATVATTVAGAEQKIRTGQRYNQISSSYVETEVSEVEAIS